MEIQYTASTRMRCCGHRNTRNAYHGGITTQSRCQAICTSRPDAHPSQTEAGNVSMSAPTIRIATSADLLVHLLDPFQVRYRVLRRNPHFRLATLNFVDKRLQLVAVSVRALASSRRSSRFGGDNVRSPPLLSLLPSSIPSG